MPAIAVIFVTFILIPFSCNATTWRQYESRDNRSPSALAVTLHATILTAFIDTQNAVSSHNSVRGHNVRSLTFSSGNLPGGRVLGSRDPTAEKDRLLTGPFGAFAEQGDQGIDFAA